MSVDLLTAKDLVSDLYCSAAWGLKNTTLDGRPVLGGCRSRDREHNPLEGEAAHNSKSKR